MANASVSERVHSMFFGILQPALLVARWPGEGC